jgi:uncharacterized membrane protein YphA (DoxX/SURF4 family)
MPVSALSIGFGCGLASVFLYSGSQKLFHWQDSVEEVTALGLPAPRLCAVLTCATQLAGGAMVASGIFAAEGAVLLAGFTVVATALGHRFWLLRGQPARREFTTALEHLAIISGLLLLAASRAGL